MSSSERLLANLKPLVLHPELLALWARGAKTTVDFEE